MKRSTADRLAGLYPREWRNRFGDEFVDLLEIQPFGPGTLWDVAVAALNEHALTLNTKEAQVAYVSNVISLAGKPSGFIPLLCSFAALTTVVVALASGAGARQPDEGAAAHIFQVLIVAQAPMLAFFGLRWARKTTWAALTILIAQIFAIGVAIAPVWYFHL